MRSKLDSRDPLWTLPKSCICNFGQPGWRNHILPHLNQTDLGQLQQVGSLQAITSLKQFWQLKSNSTILRTLCLLAGQSSVDYDHSLPLPDLTPNAHSRLQWLFEHFTKSRRWNQIIPFCDWLNVGSRFTNVEWLHEITQSKRYSFISVYLELQMECCLWACTTGCVAVVRWWISQFNSHPIRAAPSVQNDFTDLGVQMITRAVDNGHGRVVVEILSTFDAALYNRQQQCVIMTNVIKLSNLELVQCTCECCDIQQQQLMVNDFALVRRSCEQSNVAIPKFLVTHYLLEPYLTGQRVVLCQCVDAFMQQLNLEGLKWIVGTFMLDAFECSAENDIYTERNMDAPLQAACRQGDRSGVQWLVKEFRFTATEILFDGAKAFYYACIHGDLSFVQWLYQEMNLDAHKPQLRRSCARIIYDVCYYGHFPMLEWLMKTLQPTNDQLVARAFCEAYGERHQQIAQWFVNAYNYTEDHVQEIIKRHGETAAQYFEADRNKELKGAQPWLIYCNTDMG